MLAMTVFINIGNKRINIVSAIFFGICAMGGSPVVVGTGCYVALLIVVYKILEDKMIPKKHLVVFLLWLAGAVINTVAPGNYK